MSILHINEKEKTLDYTKYTHFETEKNPKRGGSLKKMKDYRWDFLFTLDSVIIVVIS